MFRTRRAFWGWTRVDWRNALACYAHYRPHVLLVGYLLCGVNQLHELVASYLQYPFAVKVFGRQAVDRSVGRVYTVLTAWGYQHSEANRRKLQRASCEVLLWNQSPHLEDLTSEVLDAVLADAHLAPYRPTVVRIAWVVQHLGFIDELPRRALPPDGVMRHPQAAAAGVSDVWVGWCWRWYHTSTLTPNTRYQHYRTLLKVGRWLAAWHPDITAPAQWTRTLAADYIAAVTRLRIGEWDEGALPPTGSVGKELAPQTKRRYLGVMRRFFVDCQEWGWIPRRFDPMRTFDTPRSVRALLAPDPRVIADDVWAKLLWAGLNLHAADLTQIAVNPHLRKGYRRYPIAFVRALTMVVLFAGLRANEIRRLRVGCIRWQRDTVAVPQTGEELAKDAVCLLDVPTTKTGGAFTKPVDRVVGEAITAWERVRPPSPAEVDPKTRAVVDFLFSYRGAQVGETYINSSLIPLLCRKAGIPTHDARGAITSHRAPATIASQLFNAHDPMSLFEVQAWLGHASPRSTQHYVKLTPTKLAKAYADAGYFERNLRMIDVLIDQEAIRSGAAAHGEAWKFYDLGHGYCTYDFYAQCPHRMACARCSFYRPKESLHPHLLEGKGNLTRLREELPLTDEERAAIDDGIALHDKLLTQLHDTPTPAGPTPRQLAAWAADGITLTPMHRS
jgi:integrase